METDELQRYIRIFNGKSNQEKYGTTTTERHNSFVSIMVVTVVSSLVIAIVVVGLAVSRYYNRRQKQTNDSSYSVIRYGRRHLPSTSCENLTPVSITNEKQSHEIVNETTRIIKNSFSWPEVKMLHQQDSEQMDISSSSLSTSSTIEQFIEQPSLTFALRWDDNTKSLFVRVVSARNLFIHRHNRQPLIIDSYVRIELLRTSTENTTQEIFPSMRTHIIKRNAFPVYNELFEFPNLEQINDENYLILFQVSTYDTFTRDEIVGEITFPIKSDSLNSTEMTFTQNLTARHRQLTNQQLGQMLVSLCYQPADSNITIIVLKASDLPRMGSSRIINPYFKIYMFYKNQRIGKKRSTIKRTTQSPVYNECFTFNIPNNDIENIYFDIVLFDYDSHMKHETIGMFSIGKEINQHWNDVCVRQVTKQMAHWYQLKSFNETNH